MSQDKKGPLHNLFARQQPKVAAKKKVGKLLTSMAEEDHKRIALLIKKWLEQDEARAKKKALPLRKKR